MRSGRGRVEVSSGNGVQLVGTTTTERERCNRFFHSIGRNNMSLSLPYLDRAAMGAVES